VARKPRGRIGTDDVDGRRQIRPRHSSRPPPGTLVRGDNAGGRAPVHAQAPKARLARIAVRLDAVDPAGAFNGNGNAKTVAPARCHHGKVFFRSGSVIAGRYGGVRKWTGHRGRHLGQKGSPILPASSACELSRGEKRTSALRRAPFGGGSRRRCDRRVGLYSSRTRIPRTVVRSPRRGGEWRQEFLLATVVISHLPVPSDKSRGVTPCRTAGAPTPARPARPARRRGMGGRATRS
jgi:hypothetical protein